MRRKPVAPWFFATIAAAAVISAQAQLNPTVNVLTKPTGPVPAYCEEGLSQAPVRRVTHAPAPQPAAPPPAADLLGALRRLQRAAASDDRPAFTSALADARAALASYPNGGQKNAAADAMQVYTDIDRFWTWSESAPTGAFYDASSDNGALLAIAKKYPGLLHAVADATLVAGGRTMYPTRETRLYLASEAGKRIARLGIRSGVAPPQTTRRRTNVQRTPSRTSEEKSAPRTHATTTRHHVTKPTSAPPAPPAATHAHARTTPARETPSHVARVTKPAAAAPAPAPTATTSTTATTPPPATASATPTTSATPSTTATTATETAAPATDTTATTASAAPPPATSDTTATAAMSSQPPATPAKEEPSRVNMIIAIVLVIVGVGLAIVLFRASD